MMQAMVDHVTGMVYWVPAADQSATVPPLPTVPVVMQPAYRMLRPVMHQQAAVGLPVEMNTTVFVRGIPREATTQSVESHFRVHGEILSCHVIRHKDASTNKGIAFVKFREATAAQRAINGNHPGIMEDREVFAEWAHPRPATSARPPVPGQHMPPPPVTYFPFPRLVPSFPAPYQVLGFPATYFPIEQPPPYTTHFPSSSQTHPPSSDHEQEPTTTKSRKGKEKEI